MDLDQLQLRNLLGDEYDRIANDVEGERSVPTVVVSGEYRGGNNVFLQFENKKTIQFLISQLQDILTHENDSMGITLAGQVMSFGEYCDRTETQ